MIALTACTGSATTGVGSGTFSDVHTALDRPGQPGRRPRGQVYFAWLAWVLLASSASWSRSWPTCRRRRPVRSAALGAVVAAAAIAITFFAIKLSSTGSYTEYLKHAHVGFYFAIAGFLLAGIGALIGPKRRY